MVLGIKKFKRLPRFDRDYKRLSVQNKSAVNRALADLISEGELPRGRKLKKIKSNKNVWAIRVTQGTRLTFEVADGTCILRNVGEHDKTLDST